MKTTSPHMHAAKGGGLDYPALSPSRTRYYRPGLAYMGTATPD
jgi:hypothetical protein